MKGLGIGFIFSCTWRVYRSRYARIEHSNTVRSHSMLEWLQEHPGLLVSAGLSVVLGIVGILVLPGVVARLPKNFFTREDRKPSLWLNIAGWALIVAGIVMMILPGPGAVVLLTGIVLADFPGKRRLLRWFLSFGTVFDGLNRIRAKRGKVPLERP